MNLKVSLVQYMNIITIAVYQHKGFFFFWSQKRTLNGSRHLVTQIIIKQRAQRRGTYILIKITIIFTVLSMSCPTGTTLIEVEYQQLHGKIFEESCGDDPYVPTQNAMYGELSIQ